MTAKGKEYKKIAAQIAKEKYPDLMPFTKEAYMSIKVYFGDKRKRDVQGHLKTLIDAFEGILYENDSQIVKLYAEKHYDKEEPRVEIKVMKL